MTVKSNMQGIGQSDFQLVDYSLNPEISEEINQAIAYLAGYYSPSQQFRALQTDVNGRLLMSTANVSVSAVNQTQVAVPTADTLCLAANPNRTNLFLQNQGSIVLSVAFAAGLSVSVPVYMQPGDTLTWDGFTGPVYAFGGTGGLLGIVEY